MKPKIKYKCMYCNKTVVLGEHLCPVKDKESFIEEETEEKRNQFSFLKKIGVVTIASLLIYGLLFRHIGYYSLLLMVFFIVLVFLVNGKDIKVYKIKKNYYKELLKLTAHNSDVAERLINHERELKPGMSRKESIQRAYEKLLYDRSR